MSLLPAMHLHCELTAVRATSTPMKPSLSAKCYTPQQEFFGFSTMAIPAKATGSIRFGEFQVNLRTGELSRLGKKLELQEKPFQTLAALLERPGELVTREELRERLWGTETFVDFDQGLNKAVNRLRETLGDSAERPRFVETLPKKGYRFIAAVQRSEPRDVGWMKWLIAGVAAILAAAILGSWRPVPPVPTVAAIVRFTNDGRPKDRLRLL